MEKRKKTLLIVGYYHLADGFRTCANYLANDYNVLFFPLLYYQSTHLDVVGDLIKYINGEELSKYENCLFPSKTRIDVVFLWYHAYFAVDQVGMTQFIQIKNGVSDSVKFIGYSWDPMPPNELPSQSKLNLISMLNCYITGDSSEIRCLKKLGVSNVEYCPSGFDPLISHYIEDDNYKCDVSIVCTNLYDDYERFPLESVRLNRKKIVDLVYENRSDIKFNIYGPNFLSQMYPDCYRGYINYANCARVFANSKINLCIHAVSYNSIGDELYFSERLPQILGSRGLLYCETEYKHLLEHDLNYVMADTTDPIGQIKEIIQNYETSKYQQIIDNGHKLALKCLTWDNIRRKLCETTECL